MKNVYIGDILLFIWDINYIDHYLNNNIILCIEESKKMVTLGNKVHVHKKIEV